jgi:hypothetical protein
MDELTRYQMFEQYRMPYKVLEFDASSTIFIPFGYSLL